jgi:hypothetical protein
MPVFIYGIHTEFVIATIAKGSSDDPTFIFTRLAIEREHHLGMGCMRVTIAVLILDDLHSTGQRLLYQKSLIVPASRKM